MKWTGCVPLVVPREYLEIDLTHPAYVRSAHVRAHVDESMQRFSACCRAEWMVDYIESAMANLMRRNWHHEGARET